MVPTKAVRWALALPVLALPALVLGLAPLPHSRACVPEFRRGDADSSGALEITDPIRVLSELFILGPPPPESCMDARDSNDDGVLNIADPIYTLGFLFGTDGYLAMISYVPGARFRTAEMPKAFAPAFSPRRIAWRVTPSPSQ